jgi:hypothetical protein
MPMEMMQQDQMPDAAGYGNRCRHLKNAYGTNATARDATVKCTDFMGMLFLARDVAHSVHLNTRSYSKHVALNIFYERIVGAADDFAEAYQGRHGLIGPISLMSAKKTANIIEFLEDQLKEIEACDMRWWISRTVRCSNLSTIS